MRIGLRLCAKPAEYFIDELGRTKLRKGQTRSMFVRALFGVMMLCERFDDSTMIVLLAVHGTVGT